LIIVKPETVIRWHRQGFKLYWRWKSKAPVGRPKIDKEIRELIKRMSLESPLWGTPRIQSELRLLGFELAESTVAKYRVRGRTSPSQTWKTFLANHAKQIAAIDFFTVPTLTWRGIRQLHERSKSRRRARSSQFRKSAGCIIVTDEPLDVGDPVSSR
jgi:putative transposase